MAALGQGTRWGDVGRRADFQDLVICQRATAAGVQYTLIELPEYLQNNMMRNTAPSPGWMEIGADGPLPTDLEGDPLLLSLRACLSFEVNLSPTRLIFGRNKGTRKRIQTLLAHHQLPSPPRQLEAPREDEVEDLHPIVNADRLIPIQAVMDRTTRGPVDYGDSPLVDTKGSMATPGAAIMKGKEQSAKHAPQTNCEHDSSDEEWQWVNDSRSTQETSLRPRLSSSSQENCVHGLRALIRLITDEPPGETDVSYETTYSQQGYLCQVSLKCMDGFSIGGRHCNLRQDAVHSAAEAAICQLTENCQIRMAASRGSASASSKAK
jgi:hypothetical protein